MKNAGYLLVAIACSGAFASEPGARVLTFEDRVQAQAAIERVYYSHQIGATQPFEAAVPHVVLEAKVHKYLDQTAALAVYWKTALTDEMLQRELARMESGTRMPERLRELYAALGNDSFLIKECLARATLVDRLTHNFYAFDQTIHAEARERAEDIHRRVSSGELDPQTEHSNRSMIDFVMSESTPMQSKPEESATIRRELSPDDFRQRREAMPEGLGHASAIKEEPDALVFTVILSESPREFRVASYAIPKRTWDDWWETAKMPLRAESIPVVATDHDLVAVSTTSRSVGLGPDRLGSNGVPCSPEDTWTPTYTEAPTGRSGHASVWTGSVMLVWGGFDGSPNGTRIGGRYDPATDTWASTSATGAPSARGNHTAVWTGSLMVVWGGDNGSQASPQFTDSGGRYNPVTDTWQPTSTVGAPTARGRHTAVWTGSLMVVWGGSVSNITRTNTGGRYDPATDTWTPTSTTGAPSQRQRHTAVWTGSLMLIWGGSDPGTYLNTGGRYDAATDTWTPISTTGVPSERENHTAVWTGNLMVVWGGSVPDNIYLNSGGRYDPVTNSWTPTSTTGAPSARASHTAVWTGNLMVVWGGHGSSYINTGGRYDPVTNTWTSTATVGAPSARGGSTTVWAGNLMVVWGGFAAPGTFPPVYLETGGRYDPATNTWTPTANGPPQRQLHSAVWTGSRMLVWGGTNGSSYLNTGESYDPATDTWQPTGGGAPSGRTRHIAVWTGSLMVVWGGSAGAGLANTFNSGGRYDPVANTWTPTSLTGAPSARYAAVAVWTGNRIVVWGGFGSSNLDTGGRYDPATDTWTPTSATGAPSARVNHTAVWTGSLMVVWGGFGGFSNLNTGGRYDPVANSWTPTSTTGAASARSSHNAVWTGSLMIVWGQVGNTGGRYDPVADNWSPTSTTGAPSARSASTAVWTGTRMVIWGGSDGGYLNTGGRYEPGTDIWSPTTTAGAPPGRQNHTAVWTGTEMIVFGGGDSIGTLKTGGRYRLESSTNDSDGDGLSECQGDCNDANPTVYPGAPELCDGIANNCSDVSWPVVPANEANSDDDAFRICQGDCNDGDATVYPGAPQLCDGTNNNCSDPSWPSVPANEANADGDGFRICHGDCNDGDAAVYPGAPQLCDGTNTDCSDPSWPSVPANEANADGDGFRICQGDCNDADPAIHPGAADPACNGVDEDCDGNDGPPPTGQVTGLRVLANKTDLTWDPFAGASVYDVVKGNVVTLRSTGGNFTPSVLGCADNRSPDTLASDAAIPPPGSAFYYLVRHHDSCDSRGTYDSGSPSQVGSRSAEINASPSSCTGE